MILSAILIFGGLYFKFLYDVPDGQDQTNTWVSWTLVILGVSGIIVSSLWKKGNPLAIEKENEETDTTYESDDIQGLDKKTAGIRGSNDEAHKSRDGDN
jgi:hypothetical protein